MRVAGTGPEGRKAAFSIFARAPSHSGIGNVCNPTIAGGARVTPEQKMLVRSSFEELIPVTDTLAARFYGRLFESDPSLRSMFLIGMRQQGRKFMDMLRSVVENLDQLDEVVKVVWQLGKRH